MGRHDSLSEKVLAGDVRAVRKMLDHGADPNVCDPGDDNWPIHYAVNKGPEMVQLLVDHGADVNIPGRGNATALTKAEARGLNDVASVLRRAGASTRTPGDEFEMDSVFRLQIEAQIRQLSFPVLLQFHDQPEGHRNPRRTHAASSYSCISPPSTSLRRTDAVELATTDSLSLVSGTRSPSPRWGRLAL